MRHNSRNCAYQQIHRRRQRRLRRSQQRRQQRQSRRQLRQRPQLRTHKAGMRSAYILFMQLNYPVEKLTAGHDIEHGFGRASPTSSSVASRTVPLVLTIHETRPLEPYTPVPAAETATEEKPAAVAADTAALCAAAGVMRMTFAGGGGGGARAEMRMNFADGGGLLGTTSTFCFCFCIRVGTACVTGCAACGEDAGKHAGIRRAMLLKASRPMQHAQSEYNEYTVVLAAMVLCAA